MMRTCFIRKGCDKYHLVWIQSGIKKETIRNMQAHANRQKPSHTIVHHHDQTMAKRVFFFTAKPQTAGMLGRQDLAVGP